MPTTIDDVRNFWDRNPLWTGEAEFEPGTPEFFESHREACIDDGMAGALDPLFFPNQKGAVLDLGCGIGFWPIEFWREGFRDITAADISHKSLALAERRAVMFGANVRFREENAEALSFPDGSFDHVNCIGVVHHTVSPARAVAEIHRVLKDDGTAVIAVYYKNIVLRNFGLFRPFVQAIGRVGAALKGRGREGIYSVPEAAEVVRLYDGAENPVGLSYTRKEFGELLGGFRVDDFFFHFFPARSLPVRIPRWLHRILDGYLPFMIYARVTKAKRPVFWEPQISRRGERAVEISMVIFAIVSFVVFGAIYFR